MADTYTVQQVLSEEEWNGSDGTAMLTFKLQLENFAEPVFAYRPASGKKPQPGDEGTVDLSGKKPKFKSAKGWAGGASNGSGGSYNDPVTIARITRSHSQEMALRLIDAAGDADELDLSQTEVVKEYLNGPLKRLIDWFDADVQRAKPPEDVPF